MRQRVEVGLPMRQNPLVAHGESSTLSYMNFSPVAFSQNQISALVLPLVSDSKKLLWARADEVNLQLDVVAQLDKTFNVFPYLTQKRTAALAKRCFLHPDQVRVWFMLQRLRHGISWDCTDIPKVRKRISSSRGTGGLKKVRPKRNSLKREEKEPGRKKARRIRDNQRPNEGRVVVENTRDDEPLEREIKAEELTQEERGRKGKRGKRGTQRTQGRTAAMGRMRKRRTERDAVERAEEITSDEVTVASAESKTCRSARKRKRRDCALPKCVVVLSDVLGVNGDVEMETKVEEEPHTSSTSPTGAVTDVGQAKVTDVTNAAVAGGPLRQRTKTRSQLAVMKKAFLCCQYPDGDDYDRLTRLSGVCRYLVVQWFSDMRYYIKKKRPHWMSQEQHGRVLANVQYRQCRAALARKASDVDRLERLCARRCSTEDGESSNV